MESQSSNAMYTIKTSVEEEVLQHIGDATTPKEAWDVLANKHSKKNDSRLQLLESEFFSLKQGSLVMQDYFMEVQSLACEISLLDPKNKVGED